MDIQKDKIKIRKKWTIDPVTKVKSSAKAYKRNKYKLETEEIIEEYEKDYNK